MGTGLKVLFGALVLTGAALALSADARLWVQSTTGLPVAGGKSAAAPQPAGKRAGGGPAPVTIATVTATSMPIVLSAPGSVEALATVAIKPRVDGQIVEVGFTEGDVVTAGQVLFRLDDRLVKAQIAQAEANIAKDEASLVDAEATLQRREQLANKQFATEAATDTARATVAGLKASIAAGRALLDAQRTQLDYLTIRAPITGRTGSLSAKLGATIRAGDAAALVTINQTKPISVTFSVPQAELAALRKAFTTNAEATVTASGSRPIKARGTLSFVDNQVDRQTGSVMAKIVAANEDEVLWPGLAVDVALTVEVREGVSAVPASAVVPAQQGMLAWVVGDGEKVAARTVKVDRIVGQTAFITEGLAAGERVVTDGQMRLAPGATVVVQGPKGDAPAPKGGKKAGEPRS